LQAARPSRRRRRRAAEDDLSSFAVDVPQAEVRRPGGVGHDVLIDGGPSVIALVADWLAANG
jgi:hypothetical protein